MLVRMRQPAIYDRLLYVVYVYVCCLEAATLRRRQNTASDYMNMSFFSYESTSFFYALCMFEF